MRVLTTKKLTLRSSDRSPIKIRVANPFVQFKGDRLLGYFFGKNEILFSKLPAGRTNRLKQWLNPIY